MVTVRFFIEDKAGDNSFTWFRNYRDFKSSLGILTKTVNKFAKIYGRHPDKYGAEVIEAK